jgi:hypothetical protein
MSNIAIIGLGKMGMSHLNSFLNDKNTYNLFLYDKNLMKINKIKKIKIKNKKIIANIKLPKYGNFEFVVIATKSKERHAIIDHILKFNNVRFVLLEKFLFNKLSEFKKFEKRHKKKLNRIYVNVWSKYFLNLINLKIKKNSFIIKVELPEKKILTNLIHFYEIFKILGKSKIKIDFNFFKLLKLKNGYHDGTGKIILKNDFGSTMEILSQKKGNNFSIEFKSKKLNERIDLINNQIKFKKRKNTIDFPLASKVTCNFYKNLKKKRNIFFPKYNLITRSSKEIIKNLSSKYKKKIYIY